MSALLTLFLIARLLVPENLVATMQWLRKIHLQGELRVETMSSQDLKKYLKHKIEESFPEKKQRAWEDFLKALQLMPQEESLEETFSSLYATYAAGVYDPEVKKLFIIQGMGLQKQETKMAQRFFGQGAAISVRDFFLAHEIVHALQDQQYDLQKFVPEEGLPTDEKLARLALVEGDATLMQYLYLLQAMGLKGEAVHNFLVNAQKNFAPLGWNVAAQGSFFKKLMVFPYFDGLPFAALAYLKGGVSALDSLYAHPPESTEQILHPRLYRLDAPKPMRDWEGGKSAEERDTLGEFFVRAWLQFRKVPQAEALAEGWGNDRLYLFLSPSFSFGWKIVWDSEKDAQDFAQAVAPYVSGPFFREGKNTCLTYALSKKREEAFTSFCALQKRDQESPTP